MKRENTPQSNDPWDWPFLLYMCRRFFHYSDEQFWRSSPTKIFALIDSHIAYESGGDKDEVKVTNA
jgi:hypothetical protein